MQYTAQVIVQVGLPLLGVGLVISRIYEEVKLSKMKKQLKRR